MRCLEHITQLHCHWMYVSGGSFVFALCETGACFCTLRGIALFTSPLSPVPQLPPSPLLPTHPPISRTLPNSKPHPLRPELPRPLKLAPRQCLREPVRPRLLTDCLLCRLLACPLAYLRSCLLLLRSWEASPCPRLVSSCCERMA